MLAAFQWKSDSDLILLIWLAIELNNLINNFLDTFISYFKIFNMSIHIYI